MGRFRSMTLMSNDILVFGEIRDGQLKSVTGELVTAAQGLASKTGGAVCIAAVGSNIGAAVEEAKSYPVAKVFTVDSPVLEKYSSQGFTSGLDAVVKVADPAVVLFAANAMGKDLSARVAARLDGALAADCTDIDIDGGALKVTRPVFLARRTPT